MKKIILTALCLLPLSAFAVNSFDGGVQDSFCFRFPATSDEQDNVLIVEAMENPDSVIIKSRRPDEGY